MQGILINSDLSDCDSNEPSDQVIPKNFIEAQSSFNRWNTLTTGAGVTQKQISNTVNKKELQLKIFFL